MAVAITASGPLGHSDAIQNALIAPTATTVRRNAKPTKNELVFTA